MDWRREHAACCRQMSVRCMRRWAWGPPMSGEATARGGVGQEGCEIDADGGRARKMSTSVGRRRARTRTSVSKHCKKTQDSTTFAPRRPTTHPSNQPTNRNLSEKTATNATRTARGESQGH
ncbi:uncharacterized protein SCHCODRAFT_02545998 [Schizophyllum commune H4-8]|uniref:uncharacterized protein n=1 Tax=Schizophyllum commune (strain H4-8 / FGSC 9210) TaxID=578458 RepID=UPI00215FA982|nr:uncharacterized protein SCHCODRAFT_02545998 [Schizophyllum commune H4-8]KAI5889997.1 hypothetical protein SCHCODRAFT_02545998 [Schizophyllum commune H4-8]